MMSTNATMSSGWPGDALAKLPGGDDALFQKLWNEQRLLFDGRPGIHDAIDYCSARLVAAALRRNERLLVTLPDFQSHRPAFLFATALIRHFLDSRLAVRSSRQRSSRIVYFGATVGIREQLRRTSVQGLQLNLAEVFSQEDISRGAAGVGWAGSSKPAVAANLPRVVTVYAPADPVAVVRASRPCWIAVDCADAATLIWLRPLLEETAHQGIAVIAWGQNPLSECVADFASGSQKFIWPPVIQRQAVSPGYVLNGDPKNVLYASDSIRLAPFVLKASSIGTFSTLLHNAGQQLVRSTQHIKGSFGKDAVAVHWKYFRSLEALAVPIDFYEAEAPRFWGLRSFGKLRSACDHFRAACMQSDPQLYRQLEDVAVLLNEAMGKVESKGCGLWDALTNLCIEDPSDGEVRILVFPSESRARLFLFAMLARYNTTEDDLRQMRTYVASLSELQRWIYSRYTAGGDGNGFLMPSDNAVWHPVLVGLPGLAMTPRLFYAFLHPKLDVVLYPHQCSSLMRRQSEWSSRLSGDIEGNVGVLARMSGLPVPPSPVPSVPARLVVEEAVEMNVETTTKMKMSTSGSIWSPEDTVSEVARLFQSDEESTSEEIVFTEQSEAGTAGTAETSEELWCAEAVKVEFDQGWQAHFAQDDVINVVRDDALDQRYVRSLRVGERVVLIHGQQRQSLYDLIISRIHRHPSIELHLAMIRRWQEDLRVAFEQWQVRTTDSDEFGASGVRDLNGLLRRMQARGSTLISTLTLSFWLRGLVLCPLDPEDLRRVAEVLDMGFVRQHYRRIEQAADRLRGLHRGLSIKLNRWLQDHATGVVRRGEDDMIDAELGLTFGDMQNSLLILRVVGIENVKGPFLRSNLGRAEKGA